LTPAAPRWLLLVHQLPAEPSNLRVKVWRRLQAVGAVAIKNSVYVLPHSSETREDLEWIRGEIVAEGGEASLFAADAIDDLTDDEVIDAFAAARRSDWERLRREIEELGDRPRAPSPDGTAAELPREPLWARQFHQLRNRAAQIDRIDYFRAPGREDALAALEGIGATGAAPAPEPPRSRKRRAAGELAGRRWLTRPRPGVDRMASAWLIRRFIDPRAEFEFAERLPADGEPVPFDMFGVEFGHHGERCTFETLVARFELSEPAIDRIARLVHDLDLRREPGLDADTATVGRLVEGLREATDEDDRLLERGMGLFEALYLAYRRESPSKMPGGRPS
jgi:hypothetical protein